MTRSLFTGIFTKVSPALLVSVALVWCPAPPAAGSQEDWNCRLKVYWGALGGAPEDRTCFFGVKPEATDDFDVGIESKKPSEPLGVYVYAWFNRPAWNQGRIANDFRAPIAEGASKRWGTAFADTWNVKTNLTNGPSGYFHPDCDPFQELQYPVAASIYITWEFGWTLEPPGPLPPDDYEFTLIYRGGINAKPAGTKLPDDMDPPAINSTWDMETTAHIVLPLWNIDFQPWLSDCSGFAAPDTAKFFILVNNPAEGVPSCAIAVDPSDPQVAPATFTFTATACCDEPFTFSWDFGDGASGTGNPIARTYGAPGAYTVTCTVTDDGGASGICQASVTVIRAGPIYVDCGSQCPHPDGSLECPYQRIQDAIDVATDGDIVVVLPGTCYETIHFLGKAITVTSTDPLDPSIVEATVIDGLGWVRTVFFVDGEVSDSVLSGFTIQHEDGLGDGVYCSSSSPTITNNTITANATAIWCDFSSPRIANNTIAGNLASGICCLYSSPTITNNIIAGNSTVGSGGGIHSVYSSPRVANCTIADNTAELSGDAIWCGYESSVTLFNSIVWNQDCPGCGLIAVDEGSSIAVSYSVACTETGEPWPGPGNICADPQLVDPANGDYHLLATSPCIDVGLNDEAPPDDIEGDPRPWPLWGIADIGADELLPWPICAISYDPAIPTVDDTITFYSGGEVPNGGIGSISWDFGDGGTATGDPVTHQYVTPGIYTVTVVVCGDDDLCTTCTAEVAVAPCLCDVAIDGRHCKMPAGGYVGQCKIGQIGARNMSFTKSCDVVMRVTDNEGKVVFQSQVITIGPGRRIRVRFEWCYTVEEIGRNLWTWEVVPVECYELTPWDNVYRSRVNVQPGRTGAPGSDWLPLSRVWRR